MTRERTLYRETYKKEAVWNDHETLTALQRLERFNGKVDRVRLLAAGRVDSGEGTPAIEYVEIRVYIAPYSGETCS